MAVGHTIKTDFAAVKKAFENNYMCLGISCDDIGGLVEIGMSNFLPGAEPCAHVTSPPHPIVHTTSTSHTPTTPTTSTSSTTSTQAQTPTKTSSSSGGPNVGLAIGLTIGIIVALFLIAVIISRKGGRKEFDTAAGGGAAVEVA